ncbi:MAG: hypothetical protein ABI600_10860 [Luteolibacter sp.]
MIEDTGTGTFTGSTSTGQGWRHLPRMALGDGHLRRDGREYCVTGIDGGLLTPAYTYSPRFHCASPAHPRASKAHHCA